MESFNGKLRDELLDGEVFDTLWEVQALTELWRQKYNHERPHSALGYRPPAPEATLASSSSAPAKNSVLLIRSVGLVGCLENKSTDHKEGIAPVPLWVRPEPRRLGWDYRSPIIADGPRR